LQCMVTQMKAQGLKAKSKVRISHCLNEEAANKLKELLLHDYPDMDIAIYPCRGLCSFYAEQGGLLVGFESC